MRVIDIPQTVDEPPYVLLWRMDDLVPVIIGMGMGFALGELILCTTASLCTTHFYRRWREGQPDGYVFHFLYWVGLFPVRSASAGNPFEREFSP